MMYLRSDTNRSPACRQICDEDKAGIRNFCPNYTERHDMIDAGHCAKSLGERCIERWLQEMLGPGGDLEGKLDGWW